MFEMRLDSLVQQIVKSHFPYKNPDFANKGLYVAFDVRMSDYDVDVTHSAFIHLIYHAQPESNCITVFAGLSTQSSSIKDVKEWKHEITHDSCWRNINVFNSVYFYMAEKLNETRKEKGLSEKAPKDFHTFVDFPFVSDKLYDLIPIAIAKDPENHYKRILTLL